jgi:hypothetical protein
MITVLKFIILLGYLNWFFTVGYSIFQIMGGRRDRLFISRAILTLIIPWIGGLIFWLFPFVTKMFEKKAKAVD